MEQLRTSAICVVFALPDYSSEVGPKIGNAIDAIRGGHHNAERIVGVAILSADWAGCGFDGFVIVECSRRDTDALRVFSMFAAIMAPGVVRCLDVDDFHCALGAVDNRAWIAEAVYFVAGFRLLPVDCTDKQVISNAT